MEGETDLRQYLEILLAGKRIIVLVTLAAVFTSALVSFFLIRPKYRAGAILIAPEVPNAEFLEALARASHPGRDIRVSLLGKQNPFAVSVLVCESEAARASELANGVADELVRATAGKVRLELFAAARPPLGAVSPRIELNVAVAGVLGSMISAFVVFFLHYWRGTATHYSLAVREASVGPDPRADPAGGIDTSSSLYLAAKARVNSLSHLPRGANLAHAIRELAKVTDLLLTRHGL